VHPVFTGSARSGAGVAHLVDGVTELLPAAEGDAAGPPSGSVFKIERGPAGEKIAYVRMFSGALKTRDRLPAGKVTAISVFEDGAFVRPRGGRCWSDRPAVGPRRGADRRRDRGGARGANGRAFSPPTLETVVVPGDGTDRRALRVALDQLAEQDPLIDVRQDGGELSLSLYGEVQKEVIQATLADDFGCRRLVPRVDHDLHRAAARRRARRSS
jgi:ribosomal protection tetracycline resistance protein